VAAADRHLALVYTGEGVRRMQSVRATCARSFHLHSPVLLALHHLTAKLGHLAPSAVRQLNGDDIIAFDVCHRRSDPIAFIDGTMDEFMAQPVIFSECVWVARREVIKYIANVKDGAHSGGGKGGPRPRKGAA
jgi:hypothetical protein